MRFRLGILFVAVLSLVGARAPADAIIIGGSNATANQFPFMVVVYENGAQICTGTVVAQRWVLTAAHCISPGAMTVHVGSLNSTSGGAIIAADQKFAHSQFSDAPFSNDAGLLHLVSNANVPAVALAGATDNDFEAQGTSARLVGWGDITPTLGLLAPPQLRSASVKIVNDVNCYGEDTSIGAQTNVCDSGLLQGQCNGDSGGAMLVNKFGSWLQIGIISNSLNVLCGYGNQIVPEASAEVNAPTIRKFISDHTGV